MEGSEMPSGHQSVDKLIRGRYFHRRNSDDDDEHEHYDSDENALDAWPPLMKGELSSYPLIMFIADNHSIITNFSSSS